MSAVQGPMPWTAVSAAWAASAPMSASEASARWPRVTARAIFLSALIFGADRPSRAGPRDGLRRHRIEGRGEPAPDRAGAGGRKLLRHHGCGNAGKAVGTPP